MADVHVLRLGHRPQRDPRITTHVGLVARALGAKRLLLDVNDEKVVQGLRDVSSRFGGDFEVEVIESWRSLVRSWPGPILHLTMYGEPYRDHTPDLAASEDPILVVVGGAKVPAETYDLATHNLSVGNQPHSEVAAVALVLSDLLGLDGLWAPRDGAELTIVPSKDGKVVEGKE